MAETKRPLRKMISDGQIQEDPGCRVARTLGGVHPPRAVKLAEANDARLTVLDVVSPVRRWGKTMQVGGRAVDIEALLLRDRNEQLRRSVPEDSWRPKHRGARHGR